VIGLFKVFPPIYDTKAQFGREIMPRGILPFLNSPLLGGNLDT